MIALLVIRSSGLLVALAMRLWLQALKPLGVLCLKAAQLLLFCLLGLLTFKLATIEFRDMLRLHLRNLALQTQVLQLQGVTIKLHLCGLCLGSGMPVLMVDWMFHDVLATNAQHQRWEPALADARIVTELSGWLPSAACCCSASDS